MKNSFPHPPPYILDKHISQPNLPNLPPNRPNNYVKAPPPVIDYSSKISPPSPSVNPYAFPVSNVNQYAFPVPMNPYAFPVSSVNPYAIPVSRSQPDNSEGNSAETLIQPQTVAPYSQNISEFPPLLSETPVNYLQMSHNHLKMPPNDPEILLNSPKMSLNSPEMPLNSLEKTSYNPQIPSNCFQVYSDFKTKNNSNPSITQESPVISIKSYIIKCDPDIAQSMHANNIEINISKKYYNSKILYNGGGFLVHTVSEEDFESIYEELNKFIDKLTIDPEAKWYFLDNVGEYVLYDYGISALIESVYKQNIYELIIKEYKNYALSAKFNANGQNYEVQFAQVGGVHRQVNSSRYGNKPEAIRAVKRAANNEKLNQDFIRKYRWEWQHESLQFRPYEDDANYLIEMSYIEFSENKKLSIALFQGTNKKTYKIDFNTLIQANEITNFMRHVRRLPIP